MDKVTHTRDWGMKDLAEKENETRLEREYRDALKRQYEAQQKKDMQSFQNSPLGLLGQKRLHLGSPGQETGLTRPKSPPGLLGQQHLHLGTSGQKTGLTREEQALLREVELAGGPLDSSFDRGTHAEKLLLDAFQKDQRSPPHSSPAQTPREQSPRGSEGSRSKKQATHQTAGRGRISDEDIVNDVLRELRRTHTASRQSGRRSPIREVDIVEQALGAMREHRAKVRQGGGTSNIRVDDVIDDVQRELRGSPAHGGYTQHEGGAYEAPILSQPMQQTLRPKRGGVGRGFR